MHMRAWCLIALLAAGPLWTAALLPGVAHGQSVGGVIASRTHAEGEAWRASIKDTLGAPAKVALLDQASLRLSGDILFIPRAAAVPILKARFGTEGDGLVGIIVDGNGENWFGVLRFVPRGFVPVDDFRTWSMDDLTRNIRGSVAAGTYTMDPDPPGDRKLRGWLQPPVFNAQNHSLIWALEIVPRNAAGNENGEAIYHAVMFGRQGYFRLDLNAVVDHLNRQMDDAVAVFDHLTFADGHGYGDFNPATDHLAPGGLAGVFGLDALHPYPWYRRIPRRDLLAPAAGGAVLVMGAGLLFLYQRRIWYLRNRRR
jgi:uncharacterized membrane-anchored protein